MPDFLGGPARPTPVFMLHSYALYGLDHFFSSSFRFNSCFTDMKTVSTFSTFSYVCYLFGSHCEMPAQIFQPFTIGCLFFNGL